jgi:hypothetical protein
MIHSMTATPNLTLLEDVAECHVMLGHYKDAQNLAYQALDGWTRMKGAEHPRALGSMDLLAYTLRHLGKFKGSEALH